MCISSLAIWHPAVRCYCLSKFSIFLKTLLNIQIFCRKLWIPSNEASFSWGFLSANNRKKKETEVTEEGILHSPCRFWWGKVGCLVIRETVLVRNESQPKWLEIITNSVCVLQWNPNPAPVWIPAVCSKGKKQRLSNKSQFQGKQKKSDLTVPRVQSGTAFALSSHTSKNSTCTSTGFFFLSIVTR